MGFNRRKLEDQRRHAAEKEAANRRATEAQVLEDAERLIAAWNERQAERCSTQESRERLRPKLKTQPSRREQPSFATESIPFRTSAIIGLTSC